MNIPENPYEMDCREQDKPEPERQRESTRKNYPKIVINVSGRGRWMQTHSTRS